MKFDLIVKDASAADVGRILALFGGTATAIPIAGTGGSIPLAANGGDDDETGDTPAVVGQLDANGLPHDNRIHSEPAKLTTKGVWRARRGVATQLVAQVEAELRARMQSAPAATPPMPTVPAMPEATAPAAVPPMPQPNAAPVYTPPAAQPVATPPMPPAVQPAPQPTPPAATGAVDFGTFMQMFTAKMATNPGLNGEYLAWAVPQLNAAHGVNMNVITDIVQCPHVIPAAIALFTENGRWN